MSRRPGRPAIHQFQTGAAYGDATTQSLFIAQDLLRDLGLVSEIFVEHADPRLADRVRLLRDYQATPDDVLLVHHSIGHGLVDWVIAAPGRKVLVYHNITPAEFFPDDPFLQHQTRLVREQLERYRPAMEAAWADSQFNADELVTYGYAAPHVLPLLLVTDDLHERPWNASVVDENDGVFTVLFVGRIERNKCQHDVIEVFRLVDRWLGRRAQCVLVGNYNVCGAYVHEIRQRVAAHALGGRVRILGQVPQDDLYAWYRAADVFLCMSEHEGFGVPLIEAMAFDVPVIAHAAASVPSTLDAAGVLVEGKSIEEIAALICLLADDTALRERIVARQRVRIEALSRARLRRGLADALAALGVAVDAPALDRGTGFGENHVHDR